MTETKNIPSSGSSSVLQNLFLETMVGSGARCTVFTMNGVQMHGVIKAYDAESILVEVDDTQKQNFVYKHAVSTITPAKYMHLEQ